MDQALRELARRAADPAGRARWLAARLRSDEVCTWPGQHDQDCRCRGTGLTWRPAVEFAARTGDPVAAVALGVQRLPERLAWLEHVTSAGRWWQTRVLYEVAVARMQRWVRDSALPECLRPLEAVQRWLSGDFTLGLLPTGPHGIVVEFQGNLYAILHSGTTGEVRIARCPTGGDTWTAVHVLSPRTVAHTGLLVSWSWPGPRLITMALDGDRPVIAHSYDGTTWITQPAGTGAAALWWALDASLRPRGLSRNYFAAGMVAGAQQEVCSAWLVEWWVNMTPGADLGYMDAELPEALAVRP